MRNIVILLCACVLGAACSTTPKSILSLNAIELQYLSAAEADAEDIVESYDAELRHWVRNAFRFALQDLERQMTSPDGMVNLEQYKVTVGNLTQQVATVMAEYDNDKANTLSELDAKYRKMKMVQLLIDQYEQSTGTSPETLQALLSEMQATYTEIEPLFNKPDATEQAGDAWESQLDLITRGLYERVRQTVSDRLTGGLLPPAPVAPTPEPIAPTE